MARAREILRAAAFLAALLPASAAAEQWTPPPAKEGYSYPDCYCTNRGRKIPMGGFACLTVGDRTFLARCDMSLNNPIWREVQEGCPGARLPSAEPGVEGVEPG